MATVKIERVGKKLIAVFPQKVIKEKNLQEDDTVFIEVVKVKQKQAKVTDLSHLWGILKGFPLTGQQVKDMSRKNWH